VCVYFLVQLLLSAKAAQLRTYSLLQSKCATIKLGLTLKLLFVYAKLPSFLNAGPYILYTPSVIAVRGELPPLTIANGINPFYLYCTILHLRLRINRDPRLPTAALI